MEKFTAKVNEIVAKLKVIVANTPDTTYEYDPQDVNANKWQGVLSYMGPLCLVPIVLNLFGGKKSKYAMYHANQGLNLLIIDLIGKYVLAGIFGKLPLIGWVFRIANLLVILISCLMVLMGILNVVAGKAKELPFIGKIKLIK